MKKFIAAVSIALLTVILALCLTGCDKGDSVKKAYEENGYTVTTVDTNNNIAKGLLTTAGYTDEQKEKIGKYELVLCAKGLTNTALVIKFPSGSELKDFLTSEDSDGKKDTSSYDSAKEKGHINGNCLFVSGSSEAEGIFKKA